MRKLSLSTKLFYGVGQVAEGLKGAAFSLALLYYYTQILGLSGSLAGAAIFIALCFDAVTDPVAGFISDNFRSRWGRRHPFMYASAIPFAVCFYYVFAPPSGLGETGLFLWMLTFCVLTRIGLTLYHVPHMALGAELTEDYIDRTTIVSYRVFFGFSGGVFSVILTSLYFFTATAEYPIGQNNPAAYPAFAHFFAVWMVATILLSAYGTHKEIPYLHQPPKDPVPFEFMQIFRDIVKALSNRSFRLLFLGSIATTIMGGLQTSLMMHFGTFFLELDNKEIVFIFAGVGVGIIFGMPVTKYSNKWFDKKPTILLASILTPIFISVPIFLMVLDLFPPNDDPWMLPLFSSFLAIATFFGVQGGITGGSLVADIVDEHELETGRRQEGIFFGAQSFLGKTVHGLGVSIAGVGIDLIEFPVQAEPGTVDPEIVDRLGLFYAISPLVAGFIAFMFYLRIRVNRESHAKTLAELEARRAAAENEK